MAKKKPAKKVAKKAASAGPVPIERGPRKKPPVGSTPRHTSHKVRAQWFQARASYPVREANVQSLMVERSIAQAAAVAPGAGPTWQLVGPTNIGGRCTALAVHPIHTDTVYLGSAGGGVWRSDNAGAIWTAQWHSQPILNIGSLAIDPKSPDTVYCGTGEANGSVDSYAGVGLFRTQDGGQTWTLLAPSATTGLPRRIGSIAIDPFDSNHIVLGGVTHDKGDAAAMFTSHDAGVTWTRENFISTQNYWCHCVVFHPTVAGVIFATIDEGGSRNGIWRSDDGGKNWKQLTKGLPSTSQIGRTSLALAPSKPDTMYAICAKSDESVLGVFKSTNRGDAWSVIGGSEFNKETQMTYGNCIAVHPTDPNRVICGGVDLHLSTDGGKSWKQASKWNAERGTKGYAHADHHAVVMPAATPGRLYDANDGGMDVSDDGGVTWSNRSNGIAATMFYDIDVCQADGRLYGGGAQDNGTLITSDDKPDDYTEILGGDGGWTVFDTRDARHFYASYYQFHIFRWRNGRMADVTPSAVSKQEHESVWMIYIMIDPNDSNKVFTASTRVWRSINDGTAWKPVSPVLDGTPVSALEVAPANSKFVYVGTERGGFFRSMDGGETWSGDLASATLPGSLITRIETHPTNAKAVWVTVAGTGHSHLYRSDDAGTTWRDADGGKLPNAPHNAVVIRPDQPNTIWVANDVAVYESRDLGITWANISGNLPNTMFIDLVYHLKDKTLTVGTYGRSIWRASVA